MSFFHGYSYSGLLCCRGCFFHILFTQEAHAFESWLEDFVYQHDYANAVISELANAMRSCLWIPALRS